MANTKIYLVGGAVRDKIIGTESKDKDFVVVAPSYVAMREMITSRGGKIFLENENFLTIRANIPEMGSADYVLARKDGIYLDGRHPKTVTAGTIEDDLARRDFTINAIAMDTECGVNGIYAIVDPHDGVADCRRRVIKCVGNPVKRFREDRLRVFRAIRFSITKGFRIEPATSQAMLTSCLDEENFDAVSTERIREELLKMFAVDWLESFGMLEHYDLINLIKARGIWLKPTTEKR